MTIVKSFFSTAVKLTGRSGQSLIEVIIAISIFAMVFSSMITLSVGGLYALEKGGEQIEAEALAQEGMEAVMSVKSRDWNLLSACSATCIVSVSAGRWTLSNGASETIGKYTRKISLSDIYRNAGNDIVASGTPGAILDPNSKEISSLVEWNVQPGIINDAKKASIITNWTSQPEADYLIVDTSSASASGSDAIGITISNGGPSNITISSMIVSWTGGSGGNTIRVVRISGNNRWSGNSASGALLDINDFTLISAAGSYPINYFRFRRSIAGATMSVTFTMLDGSQKIISGIAL